MPGGGGQNHILKNVLPIKLADPIVFNGFSYTIGSKTISYSNVWKYCTQVLTFKNVVVLVAM